MTQSLNTLSALQAARMIAAGEITSEALVRACLDRIAAREPQIKAWSAIDFDAAISAARQCDARPASGPLHGVPVAVKDVLDTHDLPTQMGSPIYAGYQTLGDAACVALARTAGAIILGKTVTCEFAGMAPGETVNPHDVTRTPGGSSSGSAAAVADFMVPLAFGTQTGGSVLRPASYCGVVGYKPTYGTFNRQGLKFAAESLDTIGVFARTIEDCALLADALTGLQGTAARMPARPPRIGLCRTHLWDRAQPEAREAVELAARRAKDAGATVTTFDLPASFTRLSQSREIVNNVERARSLAWEWAHHGEAISPQLSASVAQGLVTSHEAYVAELRFAEAARIELDALFGAFDILLAPCVAGEAPVGLGYTGDPSFQGLWTILHVPTLALPASRGPNDMPVAAQVIAPRQGDRALLDFGLWLRDVAKIDLPAPRKSQHRAET